MCWNLHSSSLRSPKLAARCTQAKGPASAPCARARRTHAGVKRDVKRVALLLRPVLHLIQVVLQLMQPSMAAWLPWPQGLQLLVNAHWPVCMLLLALIVGEHAPPSCARAGTHGLHPCRHRVLLQYLALIWVQDNDHAVIEDPEDVPTSTLLRQLLAQQRAHAHCDDQAG